MKVNIMRPKFTRAGLFKLLEYTLLFVYLILVILGGKALKNFFLPQTNVTPFHYSLNTVLDLLGLVIIALIVAPDLLRKLLSHFFTTKPFAFAPLTEEQIVSHEAGHLLALALLPNSINDLSVKAKDLATTISSIKGYVQMGRPEFETAEDMLAAIKIMLAGNCGELTLLGNSSFGNENDLIYAEYIAKEYFMFFAEKDPVRYPWFRAPENETEAAVNARSISRLIEDMKEETLRFLLRNKDLLTEAKDCLQKNKNMDNAWCQATIKRVKL